MQAADRVYWVSMSAGPHEEIEVKLHVEDAAALQRRLKQLRARLVQRVFEHNVLFDLPGRQLWKRGALLRLRWEIPSPRGTNPPRREGNSGKAWLTYKGRGKRAGHYKVRDEMEMAVAEPATFSSILEASGFQPAFIYEKFRSQFRLPGIPQLAVDLDETPVGTFLELEGGREDIDRAARALGRSSRDYITGSYWVLYRDFCRRHGRPLRNMVFASPRK
jgi:adenylate cyclase, class 2